MISMSIESRGFAANLCSENEWWTPRLAGPLIAAAVVRLTLLAVVLARAGTSALINTDTNSYLIPGRNLLLHGSFVADGSPDLLRTPGYALFLAVTSLAGLPAAALANVILSVFCVLLVWKLGRAVFDDGRIALGAAWIFAFEPIAVVNSVLLISETLFLALFLLSLERFAAFLRGRSLGYLRRLDCGLPRQPLSVRSLITCRLRWLWDCFWCWCACQAYAGRRRRCC